MAQHNWLTKKEQHVVNLLVKPLIEQFNFNLVNISNELTSQEIDTAVKERTILLARLHKHKCNGWDRVDVKIVCQQDSFQEALTAYKSRPTDPKVLKQHLDEIKKDFYMDPVSMGCMQSPGGMPEFFKTCKLYPLLKHLLAAGCIFYDGTDGGEDFCPMFFFALGKTKGQRHISGFDICVSVQPVERASSIDW